MYFIVLFDLEYNTAGLVIVDVNCIIPNAKRQKKVETHKSHLSSDGRPKNWLLKTRCSILTPNAVKPIISGKCIYNQVIYAPI